ncbi:MAG: hypothetical protein IKQ60_01850 [Candidatus Methanomethylophilaceae archaeon]|nr:hypothetical protein [Candidatus Methanomethylophilaceae archaeon]
MVARVLSPHTDLLLPLSESRKALATTSSLDTMPPNTLAGALQEDSTPCMKGVSIHPGETSRTEIPLSSTSSLSASR